MPEKRTIPIPVDLTVEMIVDDASMSAAAAQPTRKLSLEQVAEIRIESIIQNYEQDGTKLSDDQKRQIRERSLLAID